MKIRKRFFKFHKSKKDEFHDGEQDTNDKKLNDSFNNPNKKSKNERFSIKNERLSKASSIKSQSTLENRTRDSVHLTKWMRLKSIAQDFDLMIKMKIEIPEVQKTEFNTLLDEFRDMISKVQGDKRKTQDGISESDWKLLSDIIKNKEFSSVEIIHRRMISINATSEIENDISNDTGTETMHLRSLSMPAFLRDMDSDEAENTMRKSLRTSQHQSLATKDDDYCINKYDLNNIQLTARITSERYKALSNLEFETDELVECLKDVNKLVREGSNEKATANSGSIPNILANVTKANKHIEKSIQNISDRKEKENQEPSKLNAPKEVVNQVVKEAVVHSCVIS